MLIVLFIELGTYLIDIPFAGFNSVGRVGTVKRLVINFRFLFQTGSNSL